VIVRSDLQGQFGRRRWPLLRYLATRLVVHSGIIQVWRAVARRGVPLIVYFHEVTPGTGAGFMPPDPLLRVEPSLFAWVLNSLALRYRFASLDEVVNSRDPRLVAVTFDEGYRGVYQHGFPMLRRHNIPATVFLVTGHVGTNRLLWWDRLLLQARKAQECGPEAAQRLGALEPRILGGDGRIDESRLLQAFKGLSRSQQDEVWRVLDGLAEPATARQRIFLSEPEIHEMAAAGIQFGAHTRTHPLLTWLDDKELADEVVGSRDDIRRLIGRNDVWFAYPDGVFGDREEAIAREAGFQGAVQTWKRPWHRGRYAVPRAAVDMEDLCCGHDQPDPARLEITLAGFSRWAIRSLGRRDRSRDDWGRNVGLDS
jgi:peptidoglycan/xylan/chitin deacetylase (PgdA/CDA1 family)